MAFTGWKTKEVIIDHEDENYVYLSQPRGIRVSKVNYQLQKLGSFGEYFNAHYTWGGSRQNPYPAISIDRQVWSVTRILAILFVPNPEGFKFVKAKDSFNPKTMKWVVSASEGNLKRLTSDADRKIATEGLESRTKEYWNAYNRLKGYDGYTNAQRFVARNKALGLVAIPKQRSPTGHSVWVDPDTRDAVNMARADGSINDPEVRNALIERCLNQPRRNKRYKSFEKED